MNPKEHPTAQSAFFCGALWLLAFTTTAYGHGDPIDLLANTATNRLFALSNVTPGVFEPKGDVVESTLPGIGVRFDSNGIVANTGLSLDITQPLLYWDGTQVTMPSEAVQVISPDGEQTFVVDSQSEPQMGMSLGTYTGVFAWEVDSTYRINSLNPAHGIYGLAARVSSPTYEQSTPFLIPLIYDPLKTWDGAQKAVGLELLRDELIIYGSGDFNADNDVDGSDLLAWQIGYGTISLTTLPADGDADFNSAVDARDLAIWQDQYAEAGALLEPVSLPEPSTGGLLIALLLLQASGRRAG